MILIKTGVQYLFNNVTRAKKLTPKQSRLYQRNMTQIRNHPKDYVIYTKKQAENNKTALVLRSLDSGLLKELDIQKTPLEDIFTPENISKEIDAIEATINQLAATKAIVEAPLPKIKESPAPQNILTYPDVEEEMQQALVGDAVLVKNPIPEEKLAMAKPEKAPPGLKKNFGPKDLVICPKKYNEESEPYEDYFTANFLPEKRILSVKSAKDFLKELFSKKPRPPKPAPLARPEERESAGKILKRLKEEQRQKYLAEHPPEPSFIKKALDKFFPKKTENNDIPPIGKLEINELETAFKNTGTKNSPVNQTPPVLPPPLPANGAPRETIILGMQNFPQETPLKKITNGLLSLAAIPVGIIVSAAKAAQSLPELLHRPPKQISKPEIKTKIPTTTSYRGVKFVVDIKPETPKKKKGEISNQEHWRREKEKFKWALDRNDPFLKEHFFFDADEFLS